MRLNHKFNHKTNRLRNLCFVLLLNTFLIALHPETGLAMQQDPVNTGSSQQCSVILPAPTEEPIKVDKLCGELIILKDLKEEKYYLGLQVCGRNATFIFKVRPDELHNYYQLNEPKIQRGDQIKTNLGNFNVFITTFKSYHPIENCRECNNVTTPSAGEMISTLASTSNLIFPTPSPSLQATGISLTTTPVITPSDTPGITPSIPPSPTFPSPVPSSTQSQPTEIALLASPSFTPFTSETAQVTSVEETPPVTQPVEPITDDRKLILSSTVVAVILTISIGYFIMRRKRR